MCLRKNEVDDMVNFFFYDISSKSSYVYQISILIQNLLQNLKTIIIAVIRTLYPLMFDGKSKVINGRY